MTLPLATLFAIVLTTLPAHSQHQGGPHHGSPYSGLQQRDIKSLSEQQIADLRNGRGMGLAMAAELNGYPGPLHVLELADKLDLSREQRQNVQELFDAMKAEATALGEKLIERERALDREFAQQSISPESLAQLTSQIGETQGELRAVHLKYHLSTAALLSPHQRHRYAALRGYR